MASALRSDPQRRGNHCRLCESLCTSACVRHVDESRVFCFLFFYDKMWPCLFGNLLQRARLVAPNASSASTCKCMFSSYVEKGKKNETIFFASHHQFSIFHLNIETCIWEKPTLAIILHSVASLTSPHSHFCLFLSLSHTHTHTLTLTITHSPSPLFFDSWSKFTSPSLRRANTRHIRAAGKITSRVCTAAPGGSTQTGRSASFAVETEEPGRSGLPAFYRLCLCLCEICCSRKTDLCCRALAKQRCALFSSACWMELACAVACVVAGEASGG